MLTRYYHRGNITIYHGDAWEVLKNIALLEDTTVITDPPYGVEGGRGGNRQRGKANYQQVGWEDTPLYVESVIVPVIQWLHGRGFRIAITPGVRCLWSYPKPNDIGCFWTPAAAGHSAWGLTTFNPILYYGKDWRGGQGPLPNGISVTETSERNGHPCPKPLRAWRWLVNKVAKPGDVILDPFMGSGTTLRAAKDLGFAAIGIEIEEAYCQIAVERLRQEVMDC